MLATMLISRKSHNDTWEACCNQLGSAIDLQTGISIFSFLLDIPIENSCLLLEADKYFYLGRVECKAQINNYQKSKNFSKNS